MTEKSKQIISIDFETYSDVDISKAGLYRYMESPVFEILLIGFAFGDDEPTVLDFTAMTEDEKNRWKSQFEEWLNNPDIIWHAYNAEFEINVFSRWFGRNIPLDNWWDTMVTALTCGLPRSLKDVGIALGMPEDKAKLAEGKRLVTYFCTPCKPSKANGMRKRNTRLTDPEKWERFIEYNKQDVVAERAIWHKVKNYEPDESEHQAWMLSTEINRRGVMVDRKMAEEAVQITNEYNAVQIKRLEEITGLENPNSNSQLAAWLNIPSVAKEGIEEELKTAEGERREVLLLRQEIGKTSVAKYEAMLNSICHDDRVRGMFMFYGANRSGRYSGRIVQCQNLPQNHLDDLDTARQLVKDGDWESIDVLYGNVPDTLSQLIRTAFVAKDGHTFAVADFSAIEARVIAWLTDEKWRMDLFARGGDIYCQSASEMFGVPVVKHGINGELRAKGKVAELACGYGGSAGAMINMGALKMGLTEAELPEIVRKWREASPHIVNFWWTLGDAMMNAVRSGVVTNLPHGLCVWRTRKMLIMQLPSGRCLRYYDPAIGLNRFGQESITYQGYEAGKWLRLESYGPKFVENCLAEGTLVLTARGYIPIEDVKLSDRIWDGCAWVSHEGVIYKGVQEVIKVNSLLMTPEHLILTDKGWMECGKANRSYWAETCTPDGSGVCREIHEERETPVDLQVRLRKYQDTEGKGFPRKPVMRMHEGKADRREEHNPRDDKASSVRGVALNDTEMYRTDTPCMEKLRRARNNGVRKMEAVIQKLLGRHGRDLEVRNGFGQDRQYERIQSGQLPLDDQKNQCQKQAEQSVGKLGVRKNLPIRTFRDHRNRRNNAALQKDSRVAGRILTSETGLQKPVYDIRNCGPRNRFCVCDDGELRIVHNCVQGIARDCLVESMKRVARKYPNICMHVHDEMIVEVPEAEAEEALKYICDCMAEPIPWAQGLLLRGDGYITKYYRKD
jgi:DNA polymerase